jgi:hypothetical protein
MAAGEMVIELVIDGKKYQTQLKETEEQAKKAGQNIADNLGGAGGGGVFAGLSKGAAVATAAIAALAAAVGAGAFLKGAIGEAMEAEDAMKRFNASLAAAGKYSKDASDRFSNFADKMEKLTAVEADAITQNASLLVSMGRLSGEGLERATKAALDLSAGTGKDLATSFSIVAKAANGNVGALSRYGINIKETSNHAKDFENALKRLEGAFGGMAEAKANTFSGALNAMKIGFKNVQQEIGNMFIKSPEVVAAIRYIANAFGQLSEKFKDMAGGNIVGSLLKTIVSFGQGFATYVIAPLEFTYNLGKALFLALLTGATAITSAFVNVGAAIYRYVIKPVVDFLGSGIIGNLVGIFDKDAGAAIRNFVEKGTEDFAKLGESLGSSLDNGTAALAQKTSDAFGNMGDFSFTFKASEFLAGFETAINTAKPLTEELKNGIASVGDEAKKLPETFDLVKGAFEWLFFNVQVTSAQIKIAMKQMQQALFASAVSGVSNAFSAMGSALANGENAFAAFGKAILSMFGDLAIQLGQFYFTLGLANLFLNPAAAAAYIAGGAALMVLGGALKAFGGGGGSQPAVAGGALPSGGGAVQSSANGRNALGQPVDVTAAERQPTITVNVQGDVFDSEETGMRIIEVINKVGDTRGAQLNVRTT